MTYLPLKGINRIRLQLTGNYALSGCAYGDETSQYTEKSTIFPSADFTIDVSNIDVLPVWVANPYTTGEQMAILTVSVIS